MRTLSFILAFAFIFAGPSFTGQADSSLPGAGAFSFSGSSAPDTSSVAHLTLTKRVRA